MGLREVAQRWAALGIAVGACGGRAGVGAEPGASSSAVPGASELKPPANIDVAVCRSALSDGDASSETKQQPCIDCCGRTAFPWSTVYDEQCVCGHVLDDSGSLACPGIFLTYEQCSSCCIGAGFGIAIGASDDVASCSCAFKLNQQVCAAAVQAAEPSSACQLCCLNHGYLSSEYSSSGSARCQCIDGS